MMARIPTYPLTREEGYFKGIYVIYVKDSLSLMQWVG